MKIGFNKKFLALLLAIIVIIDLASIYILLNIDKIINGDLYFYGLISSLDWQNNYWIIIDSALIASFISILLIGISLSILYLANPNINRKSLKTQAFLFIATAFLATFSIFLMTKIDTIVFSELEAYNLQYDFQWTRNFYLISRLFFWLKATVLAATTILSIWTLLLITKPKQRLPKLTSIICLFFGLFAFLGSILSNSIIGLNIGLGLILIGIITGYITSQQYIQNIILTVQQKSIYQYYEKMLNESDKFKKVFYIPSEQTKNRTDTNFILSSKKEHSLLINSQDIKKALEKNPTLTSPGNHLMQLFEKELKTDFSNEGLLDLRKNLARIIVEKLEIATSFIMKIQENSVEIEFENSIFNELVLEEEFYKSIQNFGCPLASAIANLIVKATGKFVVLTNYEIDQTEKTTTVNYQLI